jgi:hypothetical protein
MASSLDLDFRHGLIEPAITHTDEGPVLWLAHGQHRVGIALSESSLRALGLAIPTSVGSDGC